MNINPISFGKTVKVSAPFHEARRIANAANGNPKLKPEVQQAIEKIFNDRDKGHALAFYFDGSKDTGYIFSGKESREYLKLLKKRATSVKNIKSKAFEQLLEEEQIQKQEKIKRDEINNVLKERYDFNRKVQNLISKTEENFVLEIGENGEKIETIPNIN